MPAPKASVVQRGSFRRQLDGVLSTPQATEIKNRQWRISDKFQGGYLKNSRNGLKKETGAQKGGRQQNKNLQMVDLLTQMELEEEEGRFRTTPSKGAPLSFEKLPPTSIEQDEGDIKLSAPSIVERSLSPLNNSAVEAPRNLITTEVAEKEQLVREMESRLLDEVDDNELVEGKFTEEPAAGTVADDKMKAFKDQINLYMSKQDYFGAALTFVVAVFVMMYFLVSEFVEEVIIVSERLVRQCHKKQCQSRSVNKLR